MDVRTIDRMVRDLNELYGMRAGLEVVASAKRAIKHALRTENWQLTYDWDYDEYILTRRA